MGDEADVRGETDDRDEADVPDEVTVRERRRGDGATGALRTVLAGASALTTATLPVFLLGALSDPIRAELGLGETAIGAAVTVMFAAAGVAAAPAGRVSERLGGPRALRIGVTITGLATAAMGAFAQSWWQLALAMVAVGAAVGLVDTGAARAFADRVPPRRQGLAFGIKEASVPGASLLAGLALPTVAVMLGWRATFVSALGVAAVVWAVMPGGRVPSRQEASATPAAEPRETQESAGLGPPRRTPPRRRVASAAVVRFAAGAGLGTGAATAAATFLVPASTALGLSVPAAGGVLSAASVASIAMRIVMGRRADTGGTAGVPVRAVASMLAAGAVGAALLAVSGPPLVTLLGAVVLLGGGWGWTGLAFLTVVRARPDAPAAAAGIVLTGLSAGGALGPLAFGAIVTGSSYAVAWSAAAATLALGGATVFSTRRSLAARQPHAH